MPKIWCTQRWQGDSGGCAPSCRIGSGGARLITQDPVPRPPSHFIDNSKDFALSGSSSLSDAGHRARVGVGFHGLPAALRPPAAVQLPAWHAVSSVGGSSSSGGSIEPGGRLAHCVGIPVGSPRSQGQREDPGESRRLHSAVAPPATAARPPPPAATAKPAQECTPCPSSACRTGEPTPSAAAG